jgi:6-phosphogluconolactonase
MNPTARQIIVVRDAQALAEAAAGRLMSRIESNSKRPAICLTGGSTPKRLYELLATPPWRARIPWDRVHWFIGDERFVAEDDRLSNIGMARRAFLDTCAPAQNIHSIPTDAATPDEAARLYQRDLQAFHSSSLNEPAPLFDLVLMGVGPDGHTASLFPDAPAVSETERWAVCVPHANVEPFVPRVSLTLPALASTREMLFLVAGRDKRDILTRVFADENLPAARARAKQGETVWLIDEAAAPRHRARS